MSISTERVRKHRAMKKMRDLSLDKNNINISGILCH